MPYRCLPDSPLFAFPSRKFRAGAVSAIIRLRRRPQADQAYRQGSYRTPVRPMCVNFNSTLQDSTKQGNSPKQNCAQYKGQNRTYTGEDDEFQQRGQNHAVYGACGENENRRMEDVHREGIVRQKLP